MASCKECLSELPCSTSLQKMYHNKAEKCPFFKNKAEYAEVKHGRWLSVGFGEYWCSVCDANGEDVLDKRGNPNWKHCPNCGAKMDGKDINAPTKNER